MPIVSVNETAPNRQAKKRLAMRVYDQSFRWVRVSARLSCFQSMQAAGVHTGFHLFAQDLLGMLIDRVSKIPGARFQALAASFAPRL